MAAMKWSAIFVLFCYSISRSAGQNVTVQKCPSFNDTFPCLCNNVEQGISLDCQSIKKETELATLFARSFQSETIYEFILRNSPLASMSGNVFGTTSFQRIILKDSFIATVAASVFQNSLSTLTYLELNAIKVTSANFPFSSLDAYVSLETIHIEDITPSSFPLIDCPNLKELRVLHFPVSSIPNFSDLSGVENLETLFINWAGLKSLNQAFYYSRNVTYLSLKGNSLDSVDSSTFENLLKVYHLDLSFNKLSSSSIAAGTFESFPLLEHLDLSVNHLEELPKDELKMLPHLKFLNASNNFFSALDPDTFIANSNLTNIYLDTNSFPVIYDNTFNGMVEQNFMISLRSCKIVYLEPAAFGGTSNSQIHLEKNQLSTLEQSWLKPLLEKNNYVYVDGNPYECGCDFSWILENPVFTTLLKGNCQDGTPFEDLDEAYFQAC